MSSRQRRFTVLVCCFGDYLRLAARCCQSIIELCDQRQRFDLYVGANSCGRATLGYLRRLGEDGAIERLVLSERNLNKDPMMRRLLETVDTEYVLWVDDDVAFTARGWDTALLDFLDAEGSPEVAGDLYFHDCDAEYDLFVTGRPWYRPRPRDRRVIFPVGRLFAAQTAFLRRHDFPDAGMIKKHDDVLLGDLCRTVGARLADYSGYEPFYSKINFHREARRGVGERFYGSNA